MADRFSKVYDNPWVSQHVPLPLADIQKGYEYQQKKYDDGMDAVADVEFVAPGPTTKGIAAKKNAEISAKINEATEKAMKTNDYAGLKNKMKALKHELDADPYVQGIKRDRELGTLVAEKELLDPNFKNHFQSFYDENGFIDQDVNKVPDMNVYSTLKPKTIAEDHQADFYAHLKDNLNKSGDPSSELTAKEYVDPATGETRLAYFNRVTQKFVKGITKDDVRVFANAWAKNPMNWKNKQSVMYNNAAKLRATNGMQGYTPEEYANDLVNAYTGYHTEMSETSSDKQITIPKDPADKSGGGGGGTSDKLPLPNLLIELIKPETTTVVDENLKGLFRDGDGTVPGAHTVDMKDAKMDIAKVVNLPKEQRAYVQYSDAIDDLYSRKGITPELLAQTDGMHSDLAAAVADNMNQTNKSKKYDIMPVMDPDGFSRYKIFEVNKDGSKKFLDKSPKEIIEEQVKGSLEYIALKKSAKKAGVDIEGKDFKSAVKSISDKYDIDTRLAMGHILEIAGDGQFVVNTGSENKYNVGNKAFVGGTFTISEGNLNASFAQIGKGDWKNIFLDPDGKGHGLIVPAGVGKVTEEYPEGEPIYKISANVEIPVSTQASDVMNKHGYTSEQYSKWKNHFNKEFAEFVGDQQFENNLQIMSEVYNESPTRLHTSIQEAINGFDPKEQPMAVINANKMLRAASGAPPEDKALAYAKMAAILMEADHGASWFAAQKIESPKKSQVGQVR